MKFHYPFFVARRLLPTKRYASLAQCIASHETSCPPVTRFASLFCTTRFPSLRLRPDHFMQNDTGKTSRETSNSQRLSLSGNVCQKNFGLGTEHCFDWLSRAGVRSFTPRRLCSHWGEKFPISIFPPQVSHEFPA